MGDKERRQEWLRSQEWQRRQEFIRAVFKRTENPAKLIDRMGEITPEIFNNKGIIEETNKRLKREGVKINPEFFGKNLLYGHQACGGGSGSGSGHPCCSVPNDRGNISFLSSTGRDLGR